MADEVNTDRCTMMKTASYMEHVYTTNGRAIKGGSRQSMNIVTNNEITDRAQHLKKQQQHEVLI